MKKLTMLLLATGILMLCTCCGNIKVSKIDSSKDFVYDSEYTYDGVENKSYISETMEKEYSINDIVLPFININSEDAIKTNNEIQQIFEELALEFKGELEQEHPTYYSISNYNKYINGDILSVVIKLESGGTAPEVNRYFSYNFDLKTGQKLSYNDIYTKAGFDDSSIEIKVKNAIKNNEIFDFIEGDERFNTYTDKSIQKYKNAVEDESVGCFLDSEGKFNVIVVLVAPVGNEIFETVIPIE